MSVVEERLNLLENKGEEMMMIFDRIEELLGTIPEIFEEDMEMIEKRYEERGKEFAPENMVMEEVGYLESRVGKIDEGLGKIKASIEEVIEELRKRDGIHFEEDLFEI